MKSRKLSFLLLAVLVFSFCFPYTHAEGDKKNSKTLNKTLGTPIRTLLNINNVSTVFKNTGISDIDRDEQNSGLVFPKGSNKTAVFQSGFLWGVRIEGDPQKRIGGAAYSEGLQGGRVLNSGVPYTQLTFEDPNATNVRIFRVRPDVYPGGPKADLSAEINDNEGSEADIRAQYEKDWTEWPAQFGAPFEDKNGNGTYQPTVDIPGVTGADQTIWFVANDLNVGNVSDLYGTLPLGVEQQATLWAYNRSGALGNMFFRKYKIINKSNTVFDSMYVSMWSDVDLGNATDDFAGCDTTLSLGYCYNANASDPTYVPLPPPAVGFDFFQGPLLNGVAGQDRNKNGVDDALDFGIFNGKKVGPGKINLPMTAFYYFARGDANVTDPTRKAASGGTEFYNFFQGRIGKTGAFFVNPNTGLPTTYALTGDPVTRNGWVDGQLLPSGDRRIGQASGPFVMSPGDTQEVVVAEICAGAIPGVDRLSAIGLLKFYDRTAQDAFDNFFDLPTAPPAPEVSIPGTYDKEQNQYYALDRKIVLDWGENVSKVNATETSNSKGYKFQGYNIYQLPNAFASVGEGKRLATYDVADGVLKIEGLYFDVTTGAVATKVQQFGNDTGLKRYFEITRDELNGGTPLINGIKYYFAVTAYSYNPTATITNLENPVSILTIIPTSKAPGAVFGAAFGDTLRAVNSGNSDGRVLPIVIDPTKLTGHNYKVTFDTMTVIDINGDPVVETVWKLTDVTLNKVLLNKQLNQTGDDEYQFVDGLFLKVTGPPPGMKGWSITGTRRFSPANGFTGLGLEGFGDAGDPFSYDQATGTIGMAGHFAFGGVGTTLNVSQYHRVILKLAAVDPTVKWNPLTTPTDPNISKGYRWVRSVPVGGNPADPSFAPWIINRGSGYPYQDYNYGVPFSAWDMTTTPPTRLTVGHFENNVVGGRVDGTYWPYHAGEATNNATAREFAFIFSEPYSETPKPAFQTNLSNNASLPLMWVMVCSRRNANAWAAGDEFEIIANVVNTKADEFTFTAPAPYGNLELAKQEVKNINVFPNPYYGVNSEELNKYNRFVTLTHLPNKATIRIFNLAGVMVRTIEKDNNSTYQRWDLANESGLPVASGLYIAYIEMPGVGETKVLKIAIIQEQQILDRF